MSLKDDPSLWRDEFSPAPTGFNRIAFQKKVDDICGTARGHSIIRVVWGAEEEIPEAAGFTHLGTAVEHKMVGRHRTRVRGVKGKVRKRRFIFEEFQAPEQVPQDDYVRIGGAGGLYVPPSLVEERKFGKWNELYIVADHSKCDPIICNSLEYFCFGDYREPDGSDLAKLGRITARRNADEHLVDPFEPVSQRAVNHFQKLANEETDAKESMESDANEERWADHRKTLKQHTVS